MEAGPRVVTSFLRRAGGFHQRSWEDFTHSGTCDECVCVCADNTQEKWNKTDGFSLEELRDQHKQEQKPTSLQQTSLKEQRSAFKHDLTGLGTRPKPKVQADT